ncbi:MAG TPA: hypothetical protein VD837_04390 [Terriglobales bacterium]|nr:hypothetical protein [Terriglobales bacterium]
MPRRVRYYFGRLNIIPVREYPEKRVLLTEGLRPGVFIQRYGVVWEFFEVNELMVGSDVYMHGYLVKFKPQSEEEIANRATHTLDKQTIRDLVSAKARFFLNVKSGLLAYHPVAGEIDREVFTATFVQLFQRAHGNFFIDAEIESINSRYRILDEIKKLGRITRVSVYLHPSNPNLNPVWQPIDEYMKETNSATYQEHHFAKAERGGLNVTEKSPIASRITMAEDGYGKADVTAEKDGDTVTISTKDRPETAFGLDDDTPPEQVLEQLAAAIRRITSRFLQ